MEDFLVASPILNFCSVMLAPFLTQEGLNPAPGNNTAQSKNQLNKEGGRDRNSAQEQNRRATHPPNPT
eukprot:5326100-Amphidinium_carterae.1